MRVLLVATFLALASASTLDAAAPRAMAVGCDGGWIPLGPVTACTCSGICTEEPGLCAAGACVAAPRPCAGGERCAFAACLLGPAATAVCIALPVSPTAPPNPPEPPFVACFPYHPQALANACAQADPARAVGSGPREVPSATVHQGSLPLCLVGNFCATVPTASVELSTTTVDAPTLEAGEATDGYVEATVACGRAPGACRVVLP